MKKILLFFCLAFSLPATAQRALIVNGWRYTTTPSATPLTNYISGGGSYTQVGNNVTTTSGDTRLVACNPSDVGTSTLALKTMEVGYDADWNTHEIGFGLTTQDYGCGFNSVEIGFYIPSNLVVYYKIVGGGETNSGYTLPASTTSKVRVRLTAGVTFWNAFFEASTDSGATWTVINPGGTALVTAIPITSPMYANLNGLDATNVFNGVAGDN